MNRPTIPPGTPHRRGGPLPAAWGVVRRARSEAVALSTAVGGWLLLAVASAPPALAAVCPEAPPGVRR